MLPVAVTEMGACFSDDLTEEERAAKLQSSAIDRKLRQERRVFENTMKILLLGAGESGKSTVVKQMKIIHGEGYSEKERESYLSVVHDNMLTSMKAIVAAMRVIDIPLAVPENKVSADLVETYPAPVPVGGALPNEVCVAIQALWDDNGIQATFKRANEFQLNDSAPYFFAESKRIFDPDYIPSQQDILRSRVMTTGIIETSFNMKKQVYRIIDVGGQRSERRKWIQCFNDVKAVLFVGALSGYDITLREDGITNRLDESLNLFQAIVNNRFFVEAAMILFLNKVDLFNDKILTTERQLRLYFPQYQGPDYDVEAASTFIKKAFMSRILHRERRVFAHFTTATDTKNIQVIIDSVVDQIVLSNMKQASLV